MIARSQLPRVGRVSRFHALESLAHAVANLDAPLANESRARRDADATGVRLKTQRDDRVRGVAIEPSSAASAERRDVRGRGDVEAGAAGDRDGRIFHVQSMTPARAMGEL